MKTHSNQKEDDPSCRNHQLNLPNDLQKIQKSNNVMGKQSNDYHVSRDLLPVYHKIPFIHYQFHPTI